MQMCSSRTCTTLHKSEEGHLHAPRVSASTTRSRTTREGGPRVSPGAPEHRYPHRHHRAPAWRVGRQLRKPHLHPASIRLLDVSGDRHRLCLPWLVLTQGERRPKAAQTRNGRGHPEHRTILWSRDRVSRPVDPPFRARGRQPRGRRVAAWSTRQGMSTAERDKIKVPDSPAGSRRFNSRLRHSNQA